MDQLFATDRVLWNFTAASHSPWPTIYPYPMGHKDLMYPNRQIEMQRYYLKDPDCALFELMNTPPDATEGVTELHKTAGKGELELVISILAAGGNEQVNATTTTHRFTPLHFAVARGSVAIVTALVKHHADVNACAGHNFTPLMCACDRGNFDMVSCLIKKGAALDKSTAGKSSLLHVVARNGNTTLLSSLLNFGMFVDSTNEDKMTPLHIATAYNHQGTVKFLIKRGACVNNRFNACNRRLGSQYSDLTALHLAVYQGSGIIVDQLLVAKANVNAKTRDGMNPLHLCCQMGYLGILKLLLKKKADIQARDDDGFTPLHYAASHGRVDVIEMLLKKKANINETVKGNSPLQLAALRGHGKTVAYLLNHKLQVNVGLSNVDKQGVIHCAIIGRQLGVLITLLGTSAGANFPDVHSWTPIHYAGVDNLNILGCEVLGSRGANPKLPTKKGWMPMHCAAYWDCLDLAYDLFVRKADLNSVGGKGCTPLHLAVRRQSESVAKLLIAEGADLNAVDNMGWTCLHEAARRGYLLLAEWLVDSKRLATIDPVNDQGITPLHLAVKFNHLKIVQLLVEHGAKVNRSLEGGVTPLHLSARYCGIDVSEFLMTHQAYIDVRTNHGEKVLPSTVSSLNPNMEVGKLFQDISTVVESFSEDVFRIEPITTYLTKGRNPNIVSWLYGSFLSRAVAYGRDEAVELLLTHEADKEMANAEGFMPIHFAVLNNKYDIILRLLRSGCMFDSQAGEHGWTPEHVAVYGRHNRMIDLLRLVSSCFNYAKTGNMMGLSDISALKITDLPLFEALTRAKSRTKNTLLTTAFTERQNVFAAELVNVLRS